MRKLWMAAAVGGLLAGPAAAQTLNDAGRLLQQVLPGQQQQPGQSQADRDRAIYEQGRRDAEQTRRGQGRDEGRYDPRRDDARRDDARRDDARRDDARRDDARRDDRRRAEDRPRDGRDQDRRRGDPDRAYDDERPARPGGRYQPSDNR